MKKLSIVLSVLILFVTGRPLLCAGSTHWEDGIHHHLHNDNSIKGMNAFSPSSLVKLMNVERGNHSVINMLEDIFIPIGVERGLQR